MNEGEEDFLVPYGEVRREALSFLSEMGYAIVEGADSLAGPGSAGHNWERRVATKDLEAGIFIQVAEKPPNPEFHVCLVRRTVKVDAMWDVSFTKARTVSYRNPERVKYAVPRIEEEFRKLVANRCPHCGGPMAERKVKDEKSKNHGKTFLGCLRYPACRGAIADWIQRAAPDDGKLVGESCPDCGKPLVVRYVKREDLPHRGQSFIGCSGYPACKRIVSKEELTALRMMGEKKDGFMLDE